MASGCGRMTLGKAYAGRKPAINHPLSTSPDFPRYPPDFSKISRAVCHETLRSLSRPPVRSVPRSLPGVGAHRSGRCRARRTRPRRRAAWPARSGKTLYSDVALRLAATLRAIGSRPVLTRDGDFFVGLRQRCDIANAQSNAVFVSVHFNGAPRTAADGVETYYYSGQSAALAASVHRRLLAVTALEDRHVRQRGFFVIRNTRIPAILSRARFSEQLHALANWSAVRRPTGSGWRRPSPAELWTATSRDFVRAHAFPVLILIPLPRE